MERDLPAEVLKEPAKPADKQQAPLENKPEALKENQVPQKSIEIEEETKNTKEVNTNESIKGGTKDEFKASDEYSDQHSNIRSKVDYNSSTKEITEKLEEEKVQQIAEQIEGIDLVKFLKAKGYSYFPKRIVNSKNIIKTIENWLQHLYCSVKDCPYNAIITYSGESSDQIYCQMHADPSKHFTEPIVFRNELTESEPFLHELEKELLYVQAKILIAKSENAGDKSYESIIEDLDSKLSIIKSTLNTMKGKVENLKEKSNIKKATNKNEEFRYRSLSFIKQDCEKCSEINNEILSIISKTSLKKKIELFIQALDNECKEIQHDEEFKSCPYLEVPDEIYEKEFNILKVPLQSKILVNNFEKKIKSNIKIIETNQKSNYCKLILMVLFIIICVTVTGFIIQKYKFTPIIKTAEQLAANLNADKHKLEAKLAEYQSQIETEKKEKIIMEVSFKDAHFYSKKLEIDLEEFKTKFAKSSEKYHELGQFQYQLSDFTPSPAKQSIFWTDGNKSICICQIKEGTNIKEGIGIRVSSSGDIYEGCWKDGKYNGKGRYIWNSGEYYVGDYIDDNRHGYGIDYSADGGRYEGEWKINKKHGKGVLYFANGNRYEGEFRDGNLNGQGTYYWKDGTKYTGEWKDGKMNGQGTFYYKDGSWWTGEWKNRLDGTKNGFGTEYAADGAVLRSGNWVNGKYVKPK